MRPSVEKIVDYFREPHAKNSIFSLVNRYSILIYDATPYLSTEIWRAPRVAGGITCEQSHAPIW
jgi:hypothetical protein